MPSIITKILSGKPKRKPPVWEIYNGQIADMRYQGHTLQEIGNKIGVTRERVRQILRGHYKNIKTALLRESQAARLIGCHSSQLSKLRKGDVINPIRHGFCYYYDRNEIEKAMLALQRNCAHCREPLPLKHVGKYCSRCQIDYRRNPYQFRSEEGKKKALECSVNWQKQHPEQYRIISNRAARKWWRKNRDKVKETSRRYYQEHKEEIRARRRRYYQEHIKIK